MSELEIEKIVNDVASSMSMEGFPLTVEDKERIKGCLSSSDKIDCVISDLVNKHTVSTN